MNRQQSQLSSTASTPKLSFLARGSLPLAPKLVREESPTCSDEEAQNHDNITPTTRCRSSVTDMTPMSSKSPHFQWSRNASSVNPSSPTSPRVSFHRTTVTSILCFQEGTSPAAPIRHVRASDVGKKVEDYVENKVKGEEGDKEVRKKPKRKKKERTSLASLREESSPSVTPASKSEPKKGQASQSPIQDFVRNGPGACFP
uniref:Uncharacterized protein n=1 Tax=Chromera velia CCMP2878 TaxID=1169474 RepID=A0A0G4HA04_9ALVE|eukprot:Cvel_6058.t1-p1 / transcript=Cvel_6058.t1 / gene=Cvel_6058 / organism=Chromera_velia_CCMP2878 / gene_product=hypothetical protein / transcript_product=hypothetical protein / location=Cvel_scaffold291:70122-70721(-) / protein_length=200 / sequence_SO=supercontig / SO=protein_coding / is_pseudo=false